MQKNWLSLGKGTRWVVGQERERLIFHIIYALWRIKTFLILIFFNLKYFVPCVCILHWKETTSGCFVEPYLQSTRLGDQLGGY